MRSFMFSMRTLFLIIVLQILFSSALTAQDNQPVGDYGGDEDTYERVDELIFKKALSAIGKSFQLPTKLFFHFQIVISRITLNSSHSIKVLMEPYQIIACKHRVIQLLNILTYTIWQMMFSVKQIHR